MKHVISVLPRCWLGLFSATLLACTGTAALAESGVPPRTQQNELIVGVDYVVPPFVGGAKVREPEGIENALLQEIAEHLDVATKAITASRQDRTGVLSAGKAQLVLAPVPSPDAARALRTQRLSSSTPALPQDKPSGFVATVVHTGYSAGPMAIMRNDTHIKTWEQLNGRTVCLSEGGLYAGAIAAQYGAIEKTFKAPADALLALRTGVCDAAVHDSTLLNEIIKLPEWKKFSARLPVGPKTSLAFILPASDTGTLARIENLTGEWAKTRYLAALTKSRAREIAFEVYLDQVIPDCH